MNKNRNRKVEIYFILYLAAIVLLLPQKRGNESKKDSSHSYIIQGPFTIQPMKTSLLCRFKSDSSGIHIISIDSVNTILYTGNVEDVRFEFEVEDLVLRQKQTITGSSRYFRFLEDNKHQELKFFWEPPLIDKMNKTYNVKVVANAKEKGSKNHFHSETQFSLIMTNIVLENPNKELASNINNNSIPNFNVQRFNNFSNEINIEPDKSNINAIAYKYWSNKILVFNANPSLDLLRKPKITVTLNPKDNYGTAEIDSIGNNTILIKGRTPTHGNMKVSISSVFKYDNKIRKTEFYVKPVPIPIPKYNKIMYPGKQYIIKPNLPFLVNQNVKAYLKDKNIILNIGDEQGETILFVPEINQIGRTITLERYVDNIILDKYDIRIRDYPNPIIDGIQLDNAGNLKIITRSFGAFNGKPNEVKLKTKGNVKIRDLRGKIPNSADKFVITQVFKCEPKDKNQKFVFEVQAVDKRGRKSSVEKYTGSH